MSVSKLLAVCRANLILLTCLFVFEFISHSFAYPVTVVPIGDGNDVNLDVGQHSTISNQNWAIGVLFIIFGLVEVFFGFKFVRITLVVIGFLSWAVATMLISVFIRWDLVFATFDPHYYYFWIWIVAGLTGAILSFRYWDVGVTLTGAFGGFALAMGIIAAANLSISNAGRYVIMGVLIIAGSGVATFFDRVFIIVATSFGGAYVFMFGVDQFTQVGYREMLVIFDFTGKTLMYHPSVGVYIMLGSSLVLAGLGIAWEFWHHDAPLLMDRKAVFRIYGRPFGKRPKRLVGERIHNRLKTKSDFYVYITSCVCLRRRTIDDVLDDLDALDPHIPETAPIPVPDAQQTVPQNGEIVEQKPEPLPVETEVPLKSAPMQENDHIPHDSGIINQPQSNSGDKCDHTPSTPTHNEHHNNAETTNIEESSAGSNEPHLQPYHPLFSSQIADHTMDMLHLVTEDDNYQGTIPRDLRLRDHQDLPAASPNPLWFVPSSSDAVSHIFLQGLHMLEVSESSQESHESVESLLDDPNTRNMSSEQ